MIPVLALALPLLLAPQGCVACHAGIEDMHPEYALSCTECHGGDPSAGTKEAAHVRPAKPIPNDERTLPLDYDLPYLRFQNPANLRVVGETCGSCHEKELDRLRKSLHGTTSGHLSDGLYENGVSHAKTDAYAVFKTGPLSQVPAFHPRTSPRGAPQTIADHYLDLPRKACMQCHVWSRGRAVRGRLGMDGDYRSEGCAACHMSYSVDGLSRSADPTINKLEPGHPLKHQFTSQVPVDTCVHCHYGDASIGLNFRGLAQLAPAMPAGPDNPGTTKSRLNGVFYLKDPGVNPPDIHFEKGMSCIDCHTFGDIMGTGETPTKMENAVEIRCIDCHGTFEKPATLVTGRGTKLKHVRQENGRYILRGKVDGKDHVVPQAVDVLTPGAPHFKAKAVSAMTPAHRKLECYACHSGWSPNFFGFHFDRNEQFTQLEVLTGERTPGRVSTQEKVFATFRNMLFGWNPDGNVSPYLVGFSTMGTIHGKDGKKVIDQGMPRTAAGLSGMTLVHHQLHTVRPAARACVECHRNDESLGLGSPNFRLARDFVFGASDRGLESIGLDRESLERSLPIATLPLEGVRALALMVDAVDAHARLAAVALDRALVVVDLRSPAFPRELGRVPIAQARDVQIRGSKAYVASAKDGLVVVELDHPDHPRVIGKTGRGDARKLALAGFYAFIVEGSEKGGGLEVVDVADPSAPKRVAFLPLDDEGRDATGEEPGAIATWWQWSRPEGKGRSRARRVAAVATVRGTLHFVDLTEPAQPELLGAGPKGRFGKISVRALASSRHFDLGSEGGGIKSVERDYLYVAGEEERGKKEQSYLVAVDATDPERPQPRGRTRLPQDVHAIEVVHVYNAPFVQSFIFAATRQAGAVVDASRSDSIAIIARLGGEGMRGLSALAVESMSFDRLFDWDGRPEKDISHPGARYFSRAEALRILRAPLEGSTELRTGR